MANDSILEKPSKPMSGPKFNACFWAQVAMNLAARRVASVEQAESLFNACCASRDTMLKTVSECLGIVWAFRSSAVFVLSRSSSQSFESALSIHHLIIRGELFGFFQIGFEYAQRLG